MISAIMEIHERLSLFFFWSKNLSYHRTEYRGQCYAYLRIQRDLADGLFDDDYRDYSTNGRQQPEKYTKLRGHVERTIYYSAATLIVL